MQLGRRNSDGTINEKTTISLPVFMMVQVLVFFASMVSAWAVARTDLQYLTEKVAALEYKQEQSIKDRSEMLDRLARIETKLEMILSEQRKIKKELY